MGTRKRPPSINFDGYVPSYGDISQLSTPELKALVLAHHNGDKTAVPFELSELRSAAEEACVAAFDVETMRTLITRSGLTHKDCNTKPLLRERCREAMRRMRENEISYRPTPRNAPRDTSFPVTWRKFDVSFSEASLGFSIGLDKGGNLTVMKVTGATGLSAGLRPGDALIGLNHCHFGDIFDVDAFASDVLERLKKAPRPVRLTFQIGDGRWPPTAEPPAHRNSFSSESSRPSSSEKKPPAAPKVLAANKPTPDLPTPPPPPKKVKDEVDVKFRERGTLGFSINLTTTGRLEVNKIRETAKSPCWLACVNPGDELVKMNGRAFGVVGKDMFDDVVRQLKQTPRPMTLTFLQKRRSSPSAPTTTAKVFKKAATTKPTPPPPSTTTESKRQTFPAPHQGLPTSATLPRPSRTTSSDPPPRPRSVEETKAEPGSHVYRYDAVFPKELLGIALALSRSIATGKYHVAVTEVRPACVATEVEAHDRLVAINGDEVAGVENETDFSLKVLKKLKATPRPLTLTFTSGDDDTNTVCWSQAYASDLFDDIDANNDGLLSQVELIKALRKNPDLAAALDLPQHIRQEDGSRDQFAAVFQKLAVKDDKTITKRQWCVGISKLASETII